MGALVILGTIFGIGIFLIWSIIVFTAHGVSFGIALKDYVKEELEKAESELFINQK